MVSDALVESEWNDETDNCHGRKTDIFSLGCVFLEILACLSEQKLPMDRQDPNFAHQPSKNAIVVPEEIQAFSHHIPGLKNWAEELDTYDEFGSLLRLAVKMISRKPEDRPSIIEVVRDVTTAGSEYFCNVCWDECTKNQNSKQMN